MIPDFPSLVQRPAPYQRSLWGHTESRICAVFRVPPILVGMQIGLMRSTYSNFEQAENHFYQSAMAPRWKRSNYFLTRLFRVFNPDVVVEHDLRQVEPLQENKDKVREMFDRGFNHGYIRMNEARDTHGLHKDETYGKMFKWQLSKSQAQQEEEIDEAEEFLIDSVLEEGLTPQELSARITDLVFYSRSDQMKGGALSKSKN